MKKSIKEIKEIEKEPRMHTIVFKERDNEGRQFFTDVDKIMPPIFMFGESCPILMGIVDDRAIFIPIENVHHFEQNFGILEDTKNAQTMAAEYRKAKKDKTDISFC